MENQKQNNKNNYKQEEDEEYYKNVIGNMIDKYGGSSPDEDNNDYEDQEFSDSNKKNRNVNRSSDDNPENHDYHEQSNQGENFIHSENQEYNDYDAQQLENQDNEEIEAYNDYNDEENMNSNENNHPRYNNYDDEEYIDEQNEQFHNNHNESNQNKDNYENDEEFMNQQYQHQMNNEDFNEEENNQDLGDRNMNTNRIASHASNANKNTSYINKNYNQLMEYDDNQEYYDDMNNEDNNEMLNPENNDDQELNDNNQYELNRNNYENHNNINDNEIHEEDMNDMDNVNSHEENEHNEYSEEEGNKSNYIQDENLEELADGTNINNQFTTNIRNNNIPSNSSNNNTVNPAFNKVKSHNVNKNLNIDLEEENPSSQDLARNINPEYQIYNNNSKNNKQQHINKMTHGNQNHNNNYNEEMNINNEEQEINEISDSKNKNNNYSNEDNLVHDNNEFNDQINNDEYNEDNNNYNNEENENDEYENENDDNINNEENNINNEEEDYNDNEKERFKNKEEDNDIENNDNYENDDVNDNNNDDNDNNHEENNEDINESHQSQNNIDLENLNLKVKKIFEFYASFGNRLNIETLGSTKYFKFAVDAGLLNNFAQQSQIKLRKSKNNNNSSNKTVNIVSKSKIDIIFSKLTNKSSKMNLEAFTKSLVLLSDEYYYYYINDNNNNNTDADINNNKFFSKTEKNQNKKKKLIVFVENILFPLYDNLFNKNSKNIDNSIIEKSSEIINDNFTLNDDLMKLLESSGVSLYSIYKTYFKHELSLSQNSKFLQKTSYNQYCSFIKDFDICPTLINKSICITSYLHLEAVNINSEEAYFNVIKNVNFGKIVNVNPNCSNILGSYFTFFKFIRILVKLSLAMFESIEANINKNSNNNNDNSASHNVRINLFEKVLYLLEKMESSYGFCNLEKKTHITHTSKTNYIYDRKTVSYLKQKQLQNNNQNNLDHYVNNYYGLNNDSSVLPDKMLKITSNSNIRTTSPGLYSNQTTNVNSPQPLSHINTERNESENNRLSPDDLKYNPNHTEFNNRTTNNQYKNTQEKLDVNNYDFSSSNPIIEFINESYGSVLLQIFEAYCSFGSDSQETKLMKSTNFNKFLKESELISDDSISKSKLSSSNSTNSKFNIRSKNVNYNQLNTNSNSNNKSGRPIFQLSHNDNRSKNSNNTLKQSNNKKEENVNPEFSQEKYLILSDIKVKTNEIDILFTSLLKLMSKEEKNSNNSNITSNYNNSKYSNKMNSSYYYNSYHDSTKPTVKAKTKGINFKAFINSLVLLSNHLISIYSLRISRIKNENTDNNNEDSLQLDIIDVINFVIQEKIFKSNQKLLIKHFESDEKIELLEALKSESEEDVNLLNILSASLEHIYFYYTCNKDSKNSKTRGLMTSLQLLSFASDFNIFPDILSKSKLLYYFKKKALEIQQDVINKLGIYDIELIDFSGFIDFIGLIAIELPMEDEPFYNRVNTIIEHLSQSRGEEKIYKRNHIKQIPLVVLFKQKIPEYLKQGDKSISVNGFYDILEV